MKAERLTLRRCPRCGYATSNPLVSCLGYQEGKPHEPTNTTIFNVIEAEPLDAVWRSSLSSLRYTAPEAWPAAASRMLRNLDQVLNADPRHPLPSAPESAPEPSDEPPPSQ